MPALSVDDVLGGNLAEFLASTSKLDKALQIFNLLQQNEDLVDEVYGHCLTIIAKRRDAKAAEVVAKESSLGLPAGEIVNVLRELTGVIADLRQQVSEFTKKPDPAPSI